MRVLSEIDLDELRALKARREPLWLDLRDPDEHELAAVGEVLGLLGVGGLLASCLLIVVWLRYTGLLDRSHDDD